MCTSEVKKGVSKITDEINKQVGDAVSTFVSDDKASQLITNVLTGPINDPLNPLGPVGAAIAPAAPVIKDKVPLVGKPTGELLEESQALGQELKEGADYVTSSQPWDELEQLAEFGGAALSGDALPSMSGGGGGGSSRVSDVLETPQEALDNLGEDISPLSEEEEAARLAALQAKFLEDQRARQRFGFADTILTSGLGARRGPVNRPTLIGA